MRTRAFLALLSLLVGGQLVHGTAGLAEWQIYTPGGHVISHSDVWKERHGDCLRSDEPSSSGEHEIYVSHLRRWRYYPDHVIGEARGGFFLFRESTAAVSFFDSENRLQRELRARGIGAPDSAWLTAADGWAEAWFPFFVWRPCQQLLAGKPVPAGISEQGCREALAPEQLDRYRLTTWGRICERRSQRPGLEEAVDPISDFCRALGGKP
jgi:hypothetical protein